MEQSSSSRYETNLYRFDSYCKKILKNEAMDCYREIEKHRQREIFFSELSEKEWNQLYMEDEYDLDTCNFRVKGFDIEVKDGLIAEALKLLSEKKREVVLMSYYLDMSDTEIARYLNLRQSTIHYHRTSSLRTLKKYLEAKTDEKT